ncbi:ATP-binding protein [Bradyrhizobium sp. STM 3557]|uniref:PAS domain-containing sensor histidine kinase n=1 Tax=Bradyrhizobium sp. STM 3557 TaxID=578920 RepID=UPI0038909681
MDQRHIDGGSAMTLDLHRRRLIVAAAAAASCAIFAADALSPVDGAVAVLYTGVVLMAAALGRRTVIATGLATAGLTTVAFLWGHSPLTHGDDPLGGASLRYAVSLVAIAITVLLTLRDRSARVTLAEQARILELSHDTVVIRDANNIIQYWNEGAERLYGWTREEAVGKVCQQLLKTVLPGKDVAQQLAQSGAWSGEIMRTRRDGTTLILASRWLQRRDPEGRQIGIIETSADLTESRQAMAERQASEQRYSTIFNAAGFAALECDLSAAMRIVLATDGRDLAHRPRSRSDLLREAAGQIRIYNANKAALALFEVDTAADLVPGAMLLAGLADAAQDMAREALAQVFAALAQGELLVETETKCATPGGRTIDAVLRVSVLPDGRDWSRVLLMAVDVTERNEARAKIERSSADLAHAGRVSILGQLAGSIAHEVNQPLAAIINYGKSGKRWLARREPDLNEVAECLDKIVANGNRAADVVGRVRALAKKTAPQTSPVDMVLLVQESLALLAREAATSSTSIRVEQSGEPAQIVCDRVQVQQVIVNLLMNALQATRGVTERPREIHVTIDGGAEETIEVAVRDSGSGIEGDPDRIFDPFFTTKSDGMGLGLSICRSIIESQGGRMHASNNALHGATVAFTLPVSIPAEARWRARPNILI